MARQKYYWKAYLWLVSYICYSLLQLIFVGLILNMKIHALNMATFITMDVKAPLGENFFENIYLEHKKLIRRWDIPMIWLINILSQKV